MPDLPGLPGFPDDQFATNHHAASDGFIEGDIQEIIVTAVHLGEASTICIVGNHQREQNIFIKTVQTHLFHIKHMGADQLIFTLTDNARNGNSHSQHLVSFYLMFIQKIQQSNSQGPIPLNCIIIYKRKCLGGKDLSDQIGDHHLHILSCKADSDSEHQILLQSQRSGPASACGFVHSAFFQQSCLEQAVCHI